MLDYKVRQDQKHLTEMEQEIAAANKEMAATRKKLEVSRQEHATYSELEHMGKKKLGGKLQISKEDYDKLTELAKEGLVSRGTIDRLEESVRTLNRRICSLTDTIRELEELREKCSPFLYAAEHFPELVSNFMARLREITRKRETERHQRVRSRDDYGR